MKFWNDFDGSILFNKVFTTPTPIGEITLFSVDINNDHSHIHIAFDISEVPDNPPLKWVTAGFNTCRLGLSCGGLSDVLIKNIPSTQKMKLTIKKHESYFLVRAQSSKSLIELKTKHPSLCGPSVYTNDPESACYQ